MPKRTPHSKPALVGLLVPMLFVLSTRTAFAQAPPAPPPPPTPDTLEYGDDSPGEPDDPDAVKPDKPRSPSAIYDAQFLRITRTQGDPIADQFKYGTATIAERGTFGSIVDPTDFYDKVGRPDLATEFERRSTARTVFMGSSVVVGSVVPYILAVAGSSIDPICFTVCTPDQQRRQRTANTMYILAGASIITGLVGFVSTLFWSAHPVGVDERRALADEHNAALKKKLGLPSDDSAQRERTPVRLRLGGAPTDGGAVGVLTVEF